MKLSAVIITKNEAHIIGKTLAALKNLADEVIIVDSGSTDETLSICRQMNARIIETNWEGYGVTKNKGIAAATNDWILSLDADEVPDEKVQQQLQQLPEGDARNVYRFNYLNIFCNKPIRHGVWGGDKHIRLFNRRLVKWNDVPVHENLIFPADINVIPLPGYIRHYTVNSVEDYMQKTLAYAKANAHKYFLQGKSAGFIKLRVAPAFNFFKNYLLRLGFLDGREGYLVCKTTAWYTFMKYVYLQEMIDNRNAGPSRS
ncbi:MAG: glycosyltransferase family 2 protein [Ferruginibacter sp.]|nr:glycosyltransferase family 2 protein [Ferruginibacter sp.]